MIAPKTRRRGADAHDYANGATRRPMLPKTGAVRRRDDAVRAARQPLSDLFADEGIFSLA